MTAAAEEEAIFCVGINMVKRCLRLKTQRGLVPLAWEGLCSQPGWRALLKPAQLGEGLQHRSHHQQPQEGRKAVQGILLRDKMVSERR